MSKRATKELPLYTKEPLVHPLESSETPSPKSQPPSPHSFDPLTAQHSPLTGTFAMSTASILPTATEVTAVAGTNIDSNAVATPAQIQAILTALKVIHTTATAKHLFATALACAHQGSSSRTNLVGAYDSIPYSVVATQVKRQCTLRQFCMYYAKYVWAALIETSKPPANWQKQGYTEETKYAAFDFFSGVTHASAPQPPSTYYRSPTQEEIRANLANAQLAIKEAQTSSLISNRAQYSALTAQAHAVHRPAISWDVE